MAVRAIAANVVREAIRQKIIYVTMLFTLLLFAVEPMLPSFNVGVRVQLFGDIALGVEYLAISVIAVALSVNQIPSEIEKRTIYNVLSKPVRRSSFVLGKYLGVLIIIAICSLIMGTAIFAFAFAYFGSTSLGLYQGVLAAGLEASLISAFAVLISTFASPTVNVFACLLFYFVGHVKNDFLRIAFGSINATNPLPLILKYALPSLENFNVNEMVARGVILSPYFAIELALYAATFSIVFLSLASLALSRKEL